VMPEIPHTARVIFYSYQVIAEKKRGEWRPRNMNPSPDDELSSYSRRLLGIEIPLYLMVFLIGN
jgi:hypothetical protein